MPSSDDYVIIGSGLAGTLLATRLSEDPTVTVTVLEAGSADFHDENIDTPGENLRYLVNNLGNPAKDWAFFSTPQKHLSDRPIFLPRGKNIGGSTLLNFIEYNRATSVEYDVFEKLGSYGWNWDNLLPYFKKSQSLEFREEDAAKAGIKFNKEYHGASGPLKITVPRYLDAVALPWVESVNSLGIKANPDSSDGDNTGVWITTTTLDSKSTRSSAGSAYYEPNQSRPNLKVIMGAHASRIITSGKDVVVATGVEYLKDGVLHTINATKEVIVSSGTYKTPQILELSGLSDSKVLSKFGISTVVDLPGVGNNLQVTACWILQSARSLIVADTPGPFFSSKASAGGMLSGLPSAFAFLPFKDFDKSGEIASLVHKLPLPTGSTLNIQKSWVKDDRVPFLELSAYNRFQLGTLPAPVAGDDYISSTIILLHPFNTGTVHISSSDVTAAPEIDHNYLDNEVDVKILAEGYRLTRKIYSTAPLKEHIESEVSPGKEIDTDAQFAEYIKKTLGSTFHPIGTASMLPRQDGGIVDSRLKVYGTKNLRVISAHLQGTVYAIAEKAADPIKEDAQK
ncbi:hypothetical protein H0H92_008563 [Tricholoma furcatifolium]|nr:hypothetical protein H0H92_008563 [Tricholoma furcatifolium]